MHASGLFSETLKSWSEKRYIDKTYATFVPFVTQQEGDCLNNHPTLEIAGFSNTMIDSIVHDKMQEFINQMGPFYQSPSEEESGNDKIVLTTSPHQQVLMQSPCKALNECSTKFFNITIQNQMS